MDGWLVPLILIVGFGIVFRGFSTIIANTARGRLEFLAVAQEAAALRGAIAEFQSALPRALSNISLQGIEVTLEQLDSRLAGIASSVETLEGIAKKTIPDLLEEVAMNTQDMRGAIAETASNIESIQRFIDQKFNPPPLRKDG